jgi:hypothetical protein
MRKRRQIHGCGAKFLEIQRRIMCKHGVSRIQADVTRQSTSRMAAMFNLPAEPVLNRRKAITHPEDSQWRASPIASLTFNVKMVF